MLCVDSKQIIDGRLECWSGSGKAEVGYESESVLEELLPWILTKLRTPIYTSILVLPLISWTSNPPV